MKRRQFLFSSLVATAGSLLAPRVSLAQALPPGRKVIIIGAGLAGLASAYELRKLNYDVTIIEAQSTPGGRVHTFRNFEEPGLYAEAGAARIPRNHDLTLKYVREFGLPLEPFYPTEGKFILVRGARTEQVGWEKFADSSLFVDLDEPDVWQKVRGGNDQLPRAFAQKLGKAIVYDAPVVHIEQESTRVSVKFKEKGMIRSMSSDILICAIPFTMLRRSR
jgi:monoamine oxidase